MENLSISDARMEKAIDPPSLASAAVVPVQIKSLPANEDIERPHKCTLCTLRFKTRGNLNEHVNFFHMKGSVVCKECPKVFETSRDLRAHRYEHSVLSGRCPHCRTNLVITGLSPVTFNEAYSLHLEYCSRKPHKRAGSQITPLMVLKMNWPTFASKSSVDQTLFSMEKDNNDSFNCSRCLLMFPDRNTLQKHNCLAEIASCTVAITSESSSESIYSEASLENNVSNTGVSLASNSTPYPSSFCIVCNLEFENEDELSQHLYEDHQNVQPEPEIPISLPAPNVLYRYQSPKVPGEAPFIDVKEFSCTFCSRTFEDEEEMLNHSESCIFSPQEGMTEEQETIVPNSNQNKETPDISNSKLNEEQREIVESLDLICTNEEDEELGNEKDQEVEDDENDLNENNSKDDHSKLNKDISDRETSQNKEPIDNADDNLDSPSKKDQIEDNSGEILIRWLCKYCKKTFGDQIGMNKHKKICLGKVSRSSSQVNESEVLNLASAEIGDVNTDIFVRWSCKYCKEQFDDKFKKENHKLICKKRDCRRKSRKSMAVSSDVSRDEVTLDEDENEATDHLIDMPLISKMTYPCEYCFEPFDEEDERNNHQNRCLKSPGLKNLVARYRCVNCSLGFRSEELFKHHQSTCPKAKTRISSFFAFCKLCRVSFTNFDLYKSHKIKCQVPRADKPDTYTCPSCHEFFNDFDKFRAHTWNCLYPDKAQCHRCSNPDQTKQNCQDCKKLRDKLDQNDEVTVQDDESSSSDDDDDDDFQIEVVKKKTRPLVEVSSESDSHSSTHHILDDDSRDQNWEFDDNAASPVDIDSLLTSCPKCQFKFDNLEDLATHCGECQAQPIPGNFEAYVNRNLPVLRCPTCKIFFRGTENLVSHKCEATNTRKRPNTEDNVADSNEPVSKRLTPSEETTKPKCHECGVFCEDFKMVIIPDGKGAKYACLSCYTEREKLLNADTGSKITSKTLSPDNNRKSVEGEIACQSKSTRKLPQKSNISEENFTFKPIYERSKQLPEKRVTRQSISNIAKKSTPYSTYVKNKPASNSAIPSAVNLTSDTVTKLMQPPRINLVRLPDNWESQPKINSKAFQTSQNTSILKPNEIKTTQVTQSKPLENKTIPVPKSMPSGNTPVIPKSKGLGFPPRKEPRTDLVIKRLIINNPNAISKNQMSEMNKKLPPIPNILSQALRNKTTLLTGLNITTSNKNPKYSPLNSQFVRSSVNQTFSPASPNPNFSPVNQNFNAHSASNQNFSPINQTLNSHLVSNQNYSTVNQNFNAHSASNQSLSSSNVNIHGFTAMNFTPSTLNQQSAGVRQRFMTFISSQNNNPRMGSFRPIQPTTNLLRFVTPNNVTFQSAGRSATPGSKPMPSLRLGNPRMIVQPAGQTPPNQNVNNEPSANGNDSMSNKENQKRLPLSSVDENDGWLLEGVLEENGTEVVVKKCICGNCYRSLANEEALKEHAWTEHKRLIVEELYLKKIENISQSVMKKALVFARDCSKTSTQPN